MAAKDNLRATIGIIRKRNGASSVSCGVLYHGEVIFSHAQGFANIGERITANNSTIYAILSNTKASITALCGILLDDGVLSWEDPVSKYLPELQTVHDPEVGKRATFLDLCSHGTGLAPLDCFGAGFFDEFLGPGSSGVKKAANLPTAYDFRTQWLYNNFLLDVVGTVVSRVCGKRSGLPLFMDSPGLEDGSIQGASGYLRSTVQDMLVWANAVMEAEDESPTPQHSNPLRQIRMTRCAHRPIVLGENGYENSYGLGCFRHMLPSKYLSCIGPNFSLLPEPPVINQDGPPRLAIAHWGQFGGCLSAFYTFPETRRAVIVMSNCNGANGDPTELIAQALCQELFNLCPRVNFEEIVEEWVRKRVDNTPCPPLDDFIGLYVNTAFDISIRVAKTFDQTAKPGTDTELLSFNINSLRRQTAKLRHYHYDIWTFMPSSRNDAARKGMMKFL
ncbi:beta-lactamase/transpeptidase-like protein [Aspergillus parasiticus]|uniref:Beta-lactamase/transpeptidase-like protein n=1 Tax=Aspergillus parasiticus TaxID=5067 RepID=A0A5N6DTW3_ASPPA|nr:beta-lactamase/transpeptidase-like protein [Aspergillus parasiticus]